MKWPLTASIKEMSLERTSSEFSRSVVWIQKLTIFIYLLSKRENWRKLKERSNKNTFKSICLQTFEPIIWPSLILDAWGAFHLCFRLSYIETFTWKNYFSFILPFAGSHSSRRHVWASKSQVEARRPHCFWRRSMILVSKPDQVDTN